MFGSCFDAYLKLPLWRPAVCRCHAPSMAGRLSFCWTAGIRSFWHYPRAIGQRRQRSRRRSQRPVFLGRSSQVGLRPWGRFLNGTLRWRMLLNKGIPCPTHGSGTTGGKFNPAWRRPDRSNGQQRDQKTSKKGRVEAVDRDSVGF